MPSQSAAHTKLVKDILAELGAEDDLRLFHNQTGAMPNERGQLVRFGLAVGSADIIGILAPRGRLIGWEVKTGRGVLSDEQRAWQAVVRAMGGVCDEVRSVEDALMSLARARIEEEALG